MSPETPGSDISVGSFWYWSIIVIFFVVLIYSLIFHVYPTFKDNGGKDWKIFWNKIELIWIILAGFGVYGAIYGTWIDVRTFISKIYLDGVAVDVTQSKDAANYLIAGYCTASDADKNLCNTLHKISEFIDYSDYRAIGDINSTLFSSNVKFQYDDINRKYFSDIRTNWDNAHLMSRDAAYELSRQLPSANYVGWLGYFWPHCLAIGFALRLSRAIAVFKL